jgi:hypothetical protein
VPTDFIQNAFMPVSKHFFILNDHVVFSAAYVFFICAHPRWFADHTRPGSLNPAEAI